MNVDARTVLGGGGFEVSAVATAVADDDNTITLSITMLGLRDRSEPISSRSSGCIRNDRCHLRAGLGNGPAHLVSAARRQCSAFPCIPDLRADLQCGEPSYRVRNDPGTCYRRRDRGASPGGPDDRIADDGSGTNGGFWKQAEIAVGMIFGLTADTEGYGIFDSAPWSGQTPDLAEPDDVVESLEDAITAQSDLGEFGRGFEDRTVAMNSAGTPHDASDHLDSKLGAGDFLNGLMSGIRFGSTTRTRLAADVVKREDAAYAASDTARGGWTRGVFAYAPNDVPSVGDIPDRGKPRSAEALPLHLLRRHSRDTGATLCAGKIELATSFTRRNVKGTITKLKDESARIWWTMSNEGRNKAVDSIPLPDAGVSIAATATGSCEAAGGDNATAVLEDTRSANKTGAAVFRVQFIDDAGEALGGWEAFDIKGAFGAKNRQGGQAKADGGRRQRRRRHDGLGSLDH